MPRLIPNMYSCIYDYIKLNIMIATFVLFINLQCMHLQFIMTYARTRYTPVRVMGLPSALTTGTGLPGSVQSSVCSVRVGRQVSMRTLVGNNGFRTFTL